MVLNPRSSLVKGTTSLSTKHRYRLHHHYSRAFQNLSMLRKSINSYLSFCKTKNLGAKPVQKIARFRWLPKWSLKVRDFNLSTQLESQRTDLSLRMEGLSAMAAI